MGNKGFTAPYGPATGNSSVAGSSKRKPKKRVPKKG